MSRQVLAGDQTDYEIKQQRRVGLARNAAPRHRTDSRHRTGNARDIGSSRQKSADVTRALDDNALLRKLDAHAHQLRTRSENHEHRSHQYRCRAILSGQGRKSQDTLLTLQSLSADCVVIRHPQSGAPHLAASLVDIPIINAGRWFSRTSLARLARFVDDS